MAMRGRGSLFGYRAVFLGCRIVLGVYRGGIGIRLPARYAEDLIQRGRAVPFLRYGRSTMREWLEMHMPVDRLDEMVPMFIEAARFVRSVDQNE